MEINTLGLVAGLNNGHAERRNNPIRTTIPNHLGFNGIPATVSIFEHKVWIAMPAFVSYFFHQKTIASRCGADSAIHGMFKNDWLEHKLLKTSRARYASRA